MESGPLVPEREEHYKHERRRQKGQILLTERRDLEIEAMQQLFADPAGYLFWRTYKII
jgi:hypothetical protein